ncbi:MAG: zinc dependent phospholipase C family protein [Lachnospiraceae bacterium]|nr:zinc dependent phospholipase C family protein [Lachnospiraceae bacterium]
MPSFYTHVIFGMENYKKLRETELKEVLQTHRKAYTLGLLGPDIFFYNLLDAPLGKKKPGEMLHLFRTNRFFRNMIEGIEQMDGEEREAGIAYLTGFIGHYLLDVHCHPYVYSHIDRKNPIKEVGEHFMLEAAMDVYFCRKYYRKNPIAIPSVPLIRISKTERKVISQLVSEAYNRTYEFPRLSISSLRFVLALGPIAMRILRDRYRRRERLLRFVEERFFGFPFLSPMFVNNRRYGIGKKEFSVFQRLFREGHKEYAEIMPKVNQMLIRRGDETVKREILRKLQNRSYHTGEECEEL